MRVADKEEAAARLERERAAAAVRAEEVRAEAEPSASAALGLLRSISQITHSLLRHSRPNT